MIEQAVVYRIHLMPSGYTTDHTTCFFPIAPKVQSIWFFVVISFYFWKASMKYHNSPKKAYADFV